MVYSPPGDPVLELWLVLPKQEGCGHLPSRLGPRFDRVGDRCVELLVLEKSSGTERISCPQCNLLLPYLPS